MPRPEPDRGKHLRGRPLPYAGLIAQTLIVFSTGASRHVTVGVCFV